MLRDRILPQSEVIRAIVLEGCPYCAVSHLVPNLLPADRVGAEVVQDRIQVLAPAQPGAFRVDQLERQLLLLEQPWVLQPRAAVVPLAAAEHVLAYSCSRDSP